MKKAIICAATVCLLLCLSSARADILSIATSRAGFNDTALWPGTCAKNLSSLTSTSTDGVSVTATDATGGIYTLIQSSGSSACGFAGNFAAGDNLLYTGNVFTPPGSGPVTLNFSSPVSGFGTQFNSDGANSPVPQPFTAQIAAFDGTTLLGTFTENGVLDNASDNSAIFLGLIDSTGADITSAVLSLTSAPPGISTGDFAVNELSLLDGPSTATPEPSSFLLFVTGLVPLGILLVSRRGRQALSGRILLAG